MVGTQNRQIFGNILPAFPAWHDVVNRNDNAKSADDTFVRKGFERNCPSARFVHAILVIGIAAARLIAAITNIDRFPVSRRPRAYFAAIFLLLSVIRLDTKRFAAMLANKLNAFPGAPFGMFCHHLRLMLVSALSGTVGVSAGARRFSVDQLTAHFASDVLPGALIVLRGMPRLILVVARTTAELLWTRFVGNKRLAAVLTLDLHSASLALSHRMLSEGGVSCRRIGLQSLSDTRNYTANGAIVL